ncbi:MAG TPA: hypothetical protein VMX55_05550 [candidate division Zixibacteria bacterium]|nr:hypothetical protein [candidate division Zixibacteria bacterium]
MTDISEVLASLKRSNLALDEINSEFNDTLKLVVKGLEELSNPIDDLIQSEKKQNEEITHYESSNLSLSKEISTLKEEKATKEKLLADTQEKYNESTEKRSKLEGKNRETMTELDTTSTNLRIVKEALSKESEQYEILEAEVQEIVTSSEQQILELEKKANQKRDVIRKVKGERMALEYLIKKGHVEFNEIKIINALEGRKITDIATITKVTGLAENLIEKTLDGLMKRNLLNYDSSSGSITITGNLKI